MTKPNEKIGRKRVFLAQETAVAVEGALNDHWFEVARCGDYYDWRYGNFSVTPDLLAALKANFDAGILGIKVALDMNHEPEHRAMAWIAELKCDDKTLCARFEDWTPEGEKSVRDGEFRYFSIEFEPLEIPAEDGVKVVPDVLKGVALTNRPVLKGMEGTFAEKERTEIINQPSPVVGDKKEAMKTLVKKFAERILAAEKATKSDAEHFSALLADLPEADRAELKEFSDKVTAKVAESEKVELAEKEKAGDTTKQLADMSKRLTDSEKMTATLLAEKKEREEETVISSMILSETNLKGFPAAQKEVVAKLVKEVGVENARKFSEALKLAVDMTGKTTEIGHGKEVAATAVDAEATKLAEERHKANPNKPLHIHLSEVYAEREASK